MSRSKPIGRRPSTTGDHMPSCNSGDHVPGDIPPNLTEQQLLNYMLDAAGDLQEVASWTTAAFRLPPCPSLLGGRPVEYAVVSGGNLASPLLSTSSTHEGVTLRIDDDRHPEFWLEVHLTVAHLGELLARAIVQRAGYDPGALQVLKALTEDLPR